jgi:hypothetical protein
MDVKVARRKVLRWNTNTYDAPSRGKWMAQYLLFKMEHDNVHQKLKRHDFAKVRCVLDLPDRKFIHDELTNHREATEYAFVPGSQKKVEYFKVLHNNVRMMDDAGTPYLHNWLNTLVEGVFHQKQFYEANYLHNTRVYKDSEWNKCKFHLDISDGPEDSNYQNLHSKAPITIYFPLGDGKVDLEINCTIHKMGRPLKYTVTMIKLNPGDLLFFNTTTCRHRTARPSVSGIQVPDRVNIMLSGFPEVLLVPSPPSPKRPNIAQTEHTDTETESE